MKSLVKLAISLVAIGALGAVFGYFYLQQWSQQPTTLSAPIDYEFSARTSLTKLSQDLHQAGLVPSADTFRLWVRLQGDFHRFQAGLYRFDGPISPRDIVSAMLKGAIYTPIVVEYTIPEGFSFPLIRNRLAARGLGTEQEITRLWTDAAFLKQLNVPSKSFEGFFYPATYRFTKTIDAREAIAMGVAKFYKELPANYREEVRKRGLSLQQAVTFASLIEIETRRNDERSMVSEVIWRRLKNGEPIGIDAAIIYGIKDYRGDITSAHLRDPNNPYNTRIHKGLPPTPIGSPAKESLLAVLNPSNEGYYYYVRDIDTPDAHYFSRTLAEHNQYVKKLVERTRRNPRVKTDPQRNNRNAIPKGK